MGDRELFTFVRHPQAIGTNNEAERTLRGARRRTILCNVFESLRLHIAEFTLAGVLQEITTWTKTGQNLVNRRLRTSGLAPPETSTLK